MKLTNQNLHTKPAFPLLRTLMFSAVLLGGLSVWAINSFITRPALAAWANQAAQATGQTSPVGKLLRATATRLAPTSAVAGAISGVVYRDQNANGLQDPAQVGPPARVAETGVANVTVTAYNAAGASVGTATSSSVNGSYTINTSDAGSGPYRVEFTGLPTSLLSGPAGTQSGTTVQFVNTVPASGVSLGINDPLDYCQVNPLLATPCYVSGNPLGNGSASTGDVLVSFPYNAGATQVTNGTTVPPGGNSPLPKKLAMGSQIGATWGEAYQRTSRTLFAASVTRRHSGYGNLGAGGIYAITNLNNATPTVTPFIDVATIGVNVGALTNATRNLPNSATDANADSAAFDAVGKIGIGDLDISEDGKTLWFTNLNDRKLYSVFVNDPPTTPTAANVASFTIPTNGCSNGDFRPWATKVYRGRVYVGGVCANQTSQVRTDLKATIYEFNPAGGGTFTSKLEFPLTYNKGITWAYDDPLDPVKPATDPVRNQWNAWTSDFSKLVIQPTRIAPARRYLVYPQPILADLEFDNDGSLIIGFLDRTAMQSGYLQADPSGVATPPCEGMSSGDMLRASNNNGTFTLESNGTVGGNTGGSGNGQGPGGGEFYFEEDFTLNGTRIHQENTLGGLAIVPGSTQVATVVFDPFTIRSGGVFWMNNTTGRTDRRYEVFPQPTDPNLPNGTFGKSAGLGDLEILCDAAPIEIGNRLWFDFDRDGIQDPGEGGIPNATVQLYKNNVLVGTATTDQNGNYYFNESNVTGGVLPNMAYEIRVNKGQLALASTVLTTANVDSGANSDARDSDAAMNGNIAVIALTTGSAGDNNHTYDFGFQPQRVDLSLTKAVTNGPYVASQQITYTLVVANATNCGIFGPCSTATDVTVRDILPAGLTFLTANPAIEFNNASSTWAVGTLAPGASRTITITARINDGFSGSIRNYAQVQTQGGFADVDSEPGNGNPVLPPAEDDEAEVTINVAPQRVDLSLLKSVASGTYAPGATITYTLMVSNAVNCGNFGPCGNATNVSIRDVLPSQLTFVSANPAATFNAATSTWTVGNLNAGASASLTITATIKADVIGSIRNYAQVQTQDGPTDIDSTPGNNPNGPPVEDDEAEVTINVGSVSIGDFVWLDKNGNGCQDPDPLEAGIAGVVVTLLRGDGTTHSQQTTGANGKYLFENLPAGSYRVRFGAPAGYVITRRNVGACGGDKDSDIDPVTGETNTVSLNPGTSNLDLDAGLYLPASLGDMLFLDANRNGIMDGGETGINGVTVMLLDANGNVVATTTTTGNGKYSFGNLAPGNYSVMFNGLPAGFIYTLRDQGANETLDSDVDPSNGKTAQVMLMSGQSYLDLDAGAYPRIDLSVTKTVSPAGPYVTGQAITYAVTVSNAVGFAQATGVTVSDVLPSGVSFTGATPSQGSFDNATGTWTVGTLASGASATLQIATTVTATTGAITNCAQVQTANEFDVDSTPGNGTANGEDDAACVTINIVTASLGDFVWVDLNGNGCQDAGEPGLPNVTVTLFRGNGTQVAQTTTGADGKYLFSNLTPGSYYVTFGQPSGFTFTSTKTCGNDATDSDAAANGQTAPVTLADGENNRNVDAGVVQGACIKGFVYVDSNDNGIKEGTEAGIGGVTITLTGTDASNNAVTRSTTTAADGSYEFCGLAPGTYKLTENQPVGYLDGKDTAGSLGGAVTNDMIANIVVASGAMGINYNFGELQTFDLTISKDHVGNFQSGASSETYILRITNLGPGSAPAPITVTDDLPAGMTYQGFSGTNWSCSGGVGASNVNCTYNGPALAVNAITTLNIRVRLSSTIQCTVVNVARVSATGDNNPNNNIARDTTKIDGCTMAPPPVPGLEECPGSILIFPVYTSDATSPSRENTKITITNTDTLRPAFVHLFFVDGTSCSVADSFICLTQSQTISFLTSDVDPGTMGYIVAVATDMNGCPTQNNRLIGDEFVKFASGHYGNLPAESYKALQPIVCNPAGNSAVINLNGTDYERPARALAASSLLSRADGNITLLTVMRTGGNLFNNAGTIGTLFGLLYDDAESAYSFSLGGNSCQIKRILSDTEPRTTPRFSSVIGAGRSGWMKFWSSSNVGIAGAVFNFNQNAGSATGAFTGGRPLHKLTLGEDAYTIPIFPPTC